MPEPLAARPELLLLLVAAGLYLLDTIQFVFSDDVVFVRGARGRWSAYWPNRYPQFARRFLVAVRPWQPNCSILRVGWPAKGVSAASAAADFVAGFEHRVARLQPLGWMSLALLPQIFIALPALYALTGALTFLLGVAAVYLQVIAMAAWLLIVRRGLQMPLGATLVIAFEVLICVPYAINTFRRATRQSPPSDVDVFELARRVLTEAQFGTFRAALAQNAGLQIAWAAADSPKLGALHRLRERAEAG